MNSFLTKFKRNVVCSSELKDNAIEWLWRDVFVQGAINSIQGVPGVGKTFLLCAVCAAVSRGGTVPHVGESAEFEKIKKGKVLFLSGDDDIKKTLLPRLRECGADLNNIAFNNGDLPGLEDEELENMIKEVKPILIIFDTLQHFLNQNININSANSMTHQIKKLKTLAEEYNVCIIVVQYINKISASGNGGEAVNYAIGSVAINGLFQAVWTLGRLKDGNAHIRGLAPTKNNLTNVALPTILFKLTPEEGFKWAGIDHSIKAEDFYKKDVKKEQYKPKIEEVKEMITHALEHKSIKSRELFDMFQDYCSPKTLRRAFDQLNIFTYKKGSEWYKGRTPNK